jgi:putative DNA primase/helicase
MPPEDGFGGLRQIGMNPLPPELEVRRVSEIEARPVWWLWQGRIARGKVTMLAGHPGLGKSQVGLDFAALLTRGGRWPDGTYAKAGSVVILSAEDDAEDTIRPRLEAAAADLTRCHVVGVVREPGKGPRTFCLQEDLVRLAAVLDDIGDVALIIVDPITAYLGEIDCIKTQRCARCSHYSPSSPPATAPPS